MPQTLHGAVIKQVLRKSAEVKLRADGFWDDDAARVRRGKRKNAVDVTPALYGVGKDWWKVAEELPQRVLEVDGFECYIGNNADGYMCENPVRKKGEMMLLTQAPLRLRTQLEHFKRKGWVRFLAEDDVKNVGKPRLLALLQQCGYPLWMSEYTAADTAHWPEVARTVWNSMRISPQATEPQLRTLVLEEWNAVQLKDYGDASPSLGETRPTLFQSIGVLFRPHQYTAKALRDPVAMEDQVRAAARVPCRRRGARDVQADRHVRPRQSARAAVP